MVGDLLQPTHLLFVLVVALLVLGPKRLPEVGRALGRGLRDFRSAISGEESPERTIPPTGEETPPATEVQQPANSAVVTPSVSGSSAPTQASPEPPAPEAPDTPSANEPTQQTEAVTTSIRRDTAA